MRKWITDARYRARVLLVITLCAVGAVGAISPMQIPVVLYKLCLGALAALVGNWADMAIFPYAQPESYLAEPWKDCSGECRDDDADYPVADTYRMVFCFALFRKALIIGACCVAVCLGL